MACAYPVMLRREPTLIFISDTGEYDGMMIYSLPFNHDVKTFDLVAKASGAFQSMRTTKLISGVDMQGCATQAMEVSSHLVPIPLPS
jgi:hypothetical protein